MNYINKEIKDGERVNYSLCDTKIEDSVYLEGESAFKECSKIEVVNSDFYGRYIFWHSKDIKIFRSNFKNDTRASFWYCDGLFLEEIISEGIKPLRESKDVHVINSRFVGEEMLWRCLAVTLENVTVQSSYFLFESKHIRAKGLNLEGKYSFQYVEDMVIEDSTLRTKDAFWHTSGCTIRDTLLIGEYIGWYSKDLTLINCRIQGTQPFCYCSNLKLINCTFIDGDRAFERSTVEATLLGDLESIYNPLSGKITYTGKKPNIIIDDESIYHLSFNQIDN